MVPKASTKDLPHTETVDSLSGCVNTFILEASYLKYLYSAVFGGVEARVLGMALGASGHTKPRMRKAGGALDVGFTGGGNATDTFGRAGRGGAAGVDNNRGGRGG